MSKITEAFNRVVAAYGTNARALTAMLGTDIATADPDRVVVEQWAGSVSGRVLDVGSGTGRWSGHLAGLGVDIEGLEPVEEFVEIARKAHPGVPFRHASIADLHGSSERWSGVLAWYSLIHLNQDELAEALTTLHRALNEGGSLLLSFFTGPRFEVFYHPVAQAYRWPVELMAEALSFAGFVVESPGVGLPGAGLSGVDPHAGHAALIAKSAGGI